MPAEARLCFNSSQQRVLVEVSHERIDTLLSTREKQINALGTKQDCPLELECSAEPTEFFTPLWQPIERRKAIGCNIGDCCAMTSNADVIIFAGRHRVIARPTGQMIGRLMVGVAGVDGESLLRRLRPEGPREFSWIEGLFPGVRCFPSAAFISPKDWLFLGIERSHCIAL